MKDEKAKEESTARKSEIKKWEDEIFNEGKEDHLLDVPAEDIVNEYGQGKKLVIKAHPRDAMDYEKIFPDAMIIEKNIPMEILNFNESISFSVAVTVTSSVIGGLANVGEKKLLGVDFLKKYAE